METTSSKIAGMSDLLNMMLGNLDDPDRQRPPTEHVPTAPVVKWKYGKPVFPLIIVKRKPMPEGDELKELHCGCKCAECISNYKAYWVEKTYSGEIKSAMDSEKELRKVIFKEIKDMENKFEKQLSEMRANWEVADTKRQQLSEALDRERSIRVEETYRREVQNNETDAVTKERILVESLLMVKQEEANKLRAESDSLREAARAALSMKDQALARLRDYEMQVNRLDRDNSELRVRLHETEIEVAKLRNKNSYLKERLGSVRPHEVHEAKMAALEMQAQSQALAQAQGKSYSRGGPGGGVGGSARQRRERAVHKQGGLTREPGSVSLLSLGSLMGSPQGLGEGSWARSGSAEGPGPGPGSGVGSRAAVNKLNKLSAQRLAPGSIALEEPSISALSSITALSGWKTRGGGVNF